MNARHLNSTAEVRSLTSSELDQVAGGPFMIPPMVVAAAKLGGAATAGAAATATLTVVTAKTIDGIQSLFN